MATRKQRIPIPPALSAKVLHNSDRTCCVCRKPSRPVQIHHIDEDPSNNNLSNLAVLCLDCHHETQLDGGFAKQLSAEVVTEYRDEWFGMVQDRRAQLVSPTHVSPTRRTRPRMTPDQARLRAQTLRALYQDLIVGLTMLEAVVEEARRPLSPSETFDMRLQALKPIINQATARIDPAWKQVRVEPGSQKVCDACDEFVSLYRHNLARLQSAASTSSGLARALEIVSTMLSTSGQLKDALARVENAVRRHIQSVDNHT